MEALIVFLVLGAIALVAVPIKQLMQQGEKLRALQGAVEKLSQRLTAVEGRLSTAPAAPISGAAAPVVEAQPFKQATPPPLPTAIPQPAAANTPPSVSASTPPWPHPISPKAAKPPFDWEALLGVKLFAWIGGFVLFLGVVFLVKYSFQNNLISPLLRVILGATIGLGLIAAGLVTGRRRYRIPGQSLCATGVLVLYADIFGAHAFYSLISLPIAFALMSVVTVGAFLLAVKLDAAVIVILGLVGGFLTPPLLTDGPNNPGLLFGYVALLNFGIAAVALRKKWDYLLLLAALGTVATEISWIPVFFTSRAPQGFPIFLGMQAQFLAFAYLRQRNTPAEQWSTRAALLTGFASFGFGLWLLSIPSLATRPGFFFDFNFLADIGLLALALLRPNPSRIAASAGSALFVILSSWTAWYLRDDLLWWALGAYLLFALIHAGFSVWPPRAATEKAGAKDWQPYVPLLALGLLFLCVWNGQTSFAVWICILLVDVIAVALAISSASIIAILLALIATLVTAGLWIATAPPVNESIIGMLTVVGGFGVFFSTASTFLARKLGIGSSDQRRHVPTLAAAMPFVLLLMLIAKLPVAVSTAVFAVALLLAVVLLSLGIIARTSWIAAVALACTWAVEREWHSLHFTNTHALLALGWYVAFFLIFTAYPFFTGGTPAMASSSKSSASILDGTAVPPANLALPWAVGAMSGVLHFSLIFQLISSAYPQLRNGLVPALFVLPYAFGIFYLITKRGLAPASGDARLAWQGGAALLFLSLIFPIQFDREWITIGWALEGLALLLLFRRVPNIYLRIVGATLLCVAFARLALNPAVLEYHGRTPVRIWNWYLYAYGLTCLCLFAGARAAHGYRQTQLERVIPRVLYTLGAVLTFLLLNIEIADYFSVGPTLTFSFSGNFARDMSYSIAWALFALALLLIGMRKQTKWVRYAGLALLLVTLAKLFLHDFASLGPLYRIGAFMAVAVILIVASFVYQRFLAPSAGEAEKPAV